MSQPDMSIAAKSGCHRRRHTFWKATTEAELGELKLESENHHCLHSWERYMYHQIRAQAKSRRFKHLLLSLGYDGSSGIDLPHHKQGSTLNKGQRKARIHIRISAMLKHEASLGDDPSVSEKGKASKKTLFFNFHRMFKHDTNETCSAFVKYFWLLLNKKNPDGTPAGIPPVCHMQTDSGSEQKNLKTVHFLFEPHWLSICFGTKPFQATRMMTPMVFLET